jgi:hypothetical protein
MLGVLLLLGWAANGLTLQRMLIAGSFAAGILGFMWLWTITIRRPAAPLTRWQWAGTVAVVVMLLAVAAALVWKCVTDPAALTR